MLSLHQLALSFGSFGRDDPLIPEKPSPQCQGLKATNFVPYVNYAGSLTNVEGILTIYPEIGGDKSAMIGVGHLSGVETPTHAASTFTRALRAPRTPRATTTTLIPSARTRGARATTKPIATVNSWKRAALSR